MKIFFVWLVGLCALPAQQPTGLTGVWERQGDAWAGMRIAITTQNERFQATIVSLPPHAQQWGFEEGDLKWKNLSHSKGGEGKFSDLYINRLRKQRYYQPTVLKIMDEGLLKTSLVNKHNEWIGQEQTWVRIGMSMM